MSRLRVDDKPDEDTRHCVISVLRFMSDAFQAIEESKLVSEYSMLGASQIMDICADALEDVKDEGGGNG